MKISNHNFLKILKCNNSKRFFRFSPNFLSHPTFRDKACLMAEFGVHWLCSKKMIQPWCVAQLIAVSSHTAKVCGFGSVRAHT